MIAASEHFECRSALAVVEAYCAGYCACHRVYEPSRGNVLKRLSKYADEAIDEVARIIDEWLNESDH